MICIFIAVSIVFIYLIIEIIKHKQIPSSVSNTFYLGGKWWFTGVISLAAFLVAAGFFSVYTGPFQFLGFLMCAGLLFVAAAPHFKEEFEGKVHVGGAITFGVASQLIAIICGSPWLACAWLAFPFYMKKSTRTFWVEITCIITFVIAMLLVA